MPQLVHRNSAGVAPRHARRTKHRHARVIALALFLAAGTALVAGPATADDHAPEVVLAGGAATLGPVASPSPVGALETLLEDGRERSRAAAAAEHERVLADQRDKTAALAKKKARAQAAKVRSSRAALRSDVVRPIAGGYRLTARFGDRNSRWGSGNHTGLDFACSSGTAVRAVADGTVTSSGFDGAYGNRIELRHEDGTVTTYNHLSTLKARGGRVSAGDVIGRVGSTGNTTGAHLHFEVIRNGSFLDPGHWLAARYVAF